MPLPSANALAGSLNCPDSKIVITDRSAILTGLVIVPRRDRTVRPISKLYEGRVFFWTFFKK